MKRTFAVAILLLSLAAIGWAVAIGNDPHKPGVDTPPLSRQELVTTGAEFVARFVTRPNTAYFWSGRTSTGVGVGPSETSEFGLAGELAAQRGGTTLEQLMSHLRIKLPNWDVPAIRR